MVSGLARGVDAIAHQAALNAGGRTIAVLGSGVDRVYPPEHRKLANKVMEQALNKAALSFEALEYVVATGYGRINVPFADKQITENVFTAGK